MSSPVIRDADPARDGAACAAIYAPFVAASAISFEQVPPDAEQMGARIERTAVTHPWLVSEQGGEVRGYAYACRYMERPAYRWAASVSVYVAGGHHREGHGRRLYDALLGRLRAQRFRIACAGITLPNAASVALHEALGFEAVGVSRGIGWKQGAWQDVGLWQLQLAPAGEQPPPEPLPPGAPPPPGYH